MKAVKYARGSKLCTILILFACLGMALAWISTTTVAWLILRYNRGINDLNYSTLLLPPRWPDFRRTLGDHYINEGTARLRRADTQRGVHLLRSGLAKNPANAHGHVLLAETYSQAGRPDLARHTLAAGWKSCRDDPGFLHAYLALLTDQQADDDVLRLAQDRLASPALRDPSLRRFLALQAARAAFATGRAETYEALLRQHDLAREPAGILLLALIEQSRGLHRLTLARLVDLTQRAPDYHPAWILLIEHGRIHQRPDIWESSVIAFLAAAPLDAGPRLSHLRMLHRRNDPLSLQCQAADFLRLFRTDADALLRLASLGAELGHPAWVEQVRALIQPDHLHSPTLSLLGAEALLAAGAPAAAWEALDALQPLPPDSPPALNSACRALHAASAFALGRNEEAHRHLGQFLSAPGVQTDAMVLAARRLAGVDAIAPARTVLRQAIQRDPHPHSTSIRILEQALATVETADLIRLLEEYRQRRALDSLLAKACDQPFRDRPPLRGTGERAIAVAQAGDRRPAGRP